MNPNAGHSFENNQSSRVSGFREAGPDTGYRREEAPHHTVQMLRSSGASLRSNSDSGGGGVIGALLALVLFLALLLSPAMIVMKLFGQQGDVFEAALNSGWAWIGSLAFWLTIAGAVFAVLNKEGGPRNAAHKRASSLPPPPNSSVSATSSAASSAKCMRIPLTKTVQGPILSTVAEPPSSDALATACETELPHPPEATTHLNSALNRPVPRALTSPTRLKATLVWLVAGCFGGHRFYLRRYWTALIQLTTFIMWITLVFTLPAAQPGEFHAAIPPFLVLTIWLPLDLVCILGGFIKDGKGMRVRAWLRTDQEMENQMNAAMPA